MGAPLAIGLPLHFTEAIAAADRRGVVLPQAYYGSLQAQARSRAFTISGLAGANQIRSALDSLNQGLKGGMTFGEWKAFAAEQDWGLPSHQLETILRTHAQTAYNAGHWAQFDRNAERRSFLLYSAINDSRTRPNHRAMDGIIRAIDDSFWDTHSPPCGFNCRCSVISLTPDQADARGGETETIPPDAVADPGWGFRPTRGLEDVKPAVAATAIDLPQPIQGEVLAWQAMIDNEKIVSRVQATIGRYDQYLTDPDLVGWMQENAGLLADYEAVTLYGYTGSYYAQMNRYLRGQSGESWDLAGTVAAGVSGLSKLTAYEGNVFRGFYVDALFDPQAFLTAHAAGDVVEYQAFTSASMSEGFGGSIQITIRSKSGRILGALSQAPKENEVLFAPSTKFRVISSESRDGVIYIELEELEDQAISVPDSHKFHQQPNHEPQRTPLDSRRADEAQGSDPSAMARFRAAHAGMSPFDWAMAHFPSARLEVEQAFPHLVKRKP